VIDCGHEHLLRPASTQNLPDGRMIVHSVCVCTLEEQRVMRGDVVTSMKFRFGGLWFSPLDLLRVGDNLGILECEACGGEAGATPCDRCHDLGVTGPDGKPLEPRVLKVN
jgi:hypothetical protein